MRKYFLGFFILSSTLPISAQQATIRLERHPNKMLTVSIKNGMRSDTIYNNLMDDKGRATVTLPEAFRDYRGMATLRTGDYAQFDFILPDENFSLSCKEEYPHGGNVIFENSPENESLQKWFYEQYIRENKLSTLTQALQAYFPEDNFYSPLEKEKDRLQKEQERLETMLQQSPLYAACFIRLYNFLNKDVTSLPVSGKEQVAKTRDFVRNELDINQLFTSGLWFNTLNGLLALYDKGMPYEHEFMADMSLLLDRANNDRIYNALAENLFSICEAMDWKEQEEQLATYLMNGRKIEEPGGKLKLLFTLFKLSKGDKAPVLAQGTLPKKQTILAFYDSDCGNCTSQMSKLAEEYSVLKKKGYEVVSIAADTDKKIFETYTAKLPWEAKYCDYEGLAGKDFRNYGILGTPTFYLIDDKGIVKGRYARVEDMSENIAGR